MANGEATVQTATGPLTMVLTDSYLIIAHVPTAGTGGSVIVADTAELDLIIEALQSLRPQLGTETEHV